MAKPPFDTKGPLCIEKFNDVGKAARNRVGGGARVAPRDLIVGDRVGQQGRVGLGERLAARLANCSNFASRSLRAWAGSCSPRYLRAAATSGMFGSDSPRSL
jgi:hypothetical protein